MMEARELLIRSFTRKGLVPAQLPGLAVAFTRRRRRADKFGCAQLTGSLFRTSNFVPLCEQTIGSYSIFFISLPLERVLLDFASTVHVSGFRIKT